MREKLFCVIGSRKAGYCRRGAENLKVGLFSILFALPFFAISATISAQPTMTRGQQILTINYDECLRRAQSAFSSEGWVNIGTSGNAVAAFKGINGSYIVCNPAPDNSMAVNIFVTSSSSDSGVPGGERVRLQGRMGGSVPAGFELRTGTYEVNAANNHSTWTLSVSGNEISGQSVWSCCPGRRTDPLYGRFDGRKIRIIRPCSGQGYNNACEQVFEGTITDKGASGTFTLNGQYFGTWTLTNKP